MSNRKKAEQNRRERFNALRAAQRKYCALFAEYRNDDTGFLRPLSQEESRRFYDAKNEMAELEKICFGKVRPTARMQRVIDQYNASEVREHGKAV